MKHRKDSEADRTAVTNTAAMQGKWSTEIRHRSERSLRQNVVAGILALVVATGIGRFAYTPVLPAMLERFDLSNAIAGGLASSNYLGHLVGAVLAALVPTSRSRDVLLRTSLWTVAAATVCVGLTTDYLAWVALRFVAGLAGAGAFVLASAVMLEELSRRGHLRLSGLFYSGPGIGIAISGLLVLSLNRLLAGEPAAWRAEWVLLGVLAFVLVLPCVAWLPIGKAAHQSTGHARDSVVPKKGATGSTDGAAAGAPFALALLALAYFLEGVGYIVTGTFLPTIVESLPGLGSLGAGAWILVGLAAAPSALLWADMASRLGAATALAAAYVVQATGILLPAVSDAWWAAATSSTLFGSTFVGIAALTLTYAREVTGARRASLAIGLLTAVYGAGQVLGPLVAAHLANDAGNFGPALIAASAVVALGGLLMLVVGLFVTTSIGGRKEYVHGNKH
jgi:MFS family permease